MSSLYLIIYAFLLYSCPFVSSWRNRKVPAIKFGSIGGFDAPQIALLRGGGGGSASIADLKVPQSSNIAEVIVKGANAKASCVEEDSTVGIEKGMAKELG